MKYKDVQLSSRQLLLDISSMINQARKLLKKENDYNVLLKVIIEKDYYYNEDSELPTIKELTQETDIKYDKVRRYLRQIYKDLLGLNGNFDSSLFSFDSVKYSFSVQGRDKDQYMYFTSSSLPIALRVGEQVHLHFFKAWLDQDLFHVESINHYFRNGEQEVHHSLKSGRFSPYWQYRKDKAREEGELGFRDFWDLDDWELKRKLRVGRW